MIKWIKPSGLEITTNERSETVAYCEKLGWERAKREILHPAKQDNISRSDAKAAVKKVIGDKGWGKPGSIEWHETALYGMHDKKEIEDYVKDICGFDIDRRGGVKAVRNKAVKVLQQFIDNRLLASQPRG